MLVYALVREGPLFFSMRFSLRGLGLSLLIHSIFLFLMVYVHGFPGFVFPSQCLGQHPVLPDQALPGNTSPASAAVLFHARSRFSSRRKPPLFHLLCCGCSFFSSSYMPQSGPYPRLRAPPPPPPGLSVRRPQLFTKCYHSDRPAFGQAFPPLCPRAFHVGRTGTSTAQGRPAVFSPSAPDRSHGAVPHPQPPPVFFLTHLALSPLREKADVGVCSFTPTPPCVQSNRR